MALAAGPMFRRLGIAVLGRPGHQRLIDAQLPLALQQLQARSLGAQIDGESATACSLAADRAITAHERHRLGRANGELDAAAVAGALELHAGPSASCRWGWWIVRRLVAGHAVRAYWPFASGALPWVFLMVWPARCSVLCRDRAVHNKAD